MHIEEKAQTKKKLTAQDHGLNMIAYLAKIFVDTTPIEAEDRLMRVAGVCFIFMCCEFLGGYISNSVAIMSDAAHLLSDLLSFGIGIVSVKLAKRGKTNIQNFGYERAEVVGAVLSIVMIWI